MGILNFHIENTAVLQIKRVKLFRKDKHPDSGKAVLPATRLEFSLLLVLPFIPTSPVALHTHDTTEVMSDVVGHAFCVKSVVRA